MTLVTQAEVVHEPASILDEIRTTSTKVDPPPERLTLIFNWVVNCAQTGQRSVHSCTDAACDPWKQRTTQQTTEGTACQFSRILFDVSPAFKLVLFWGRLGAEDQWVACGPRAMFWKEKFCFGEKFSSAAETKQDLGKMVPLTKYPESKVIVLTQSFGAHWKQDNSLVLRNTTKSDSHCTAACFHGTSKSALLSVQTTRLMQ